MEKKRGLNQGINKVQRASSLTSHLKGVKLGAVSLAMTSAMPNQRIGPGWVASASLTGGARARLPVDGAAHERTAALIGGAGMSLKKRGYTTWSTQVKGASAGPSGVATRRRRTEKSWVIAVDSGMAKQELVRTVIVG